MKTSAPALPLLLAALLLAAPPAQARDTDPPDSLYRFDAALTSQADTANWWATSGGTTYLSFMQDPACNIGLATWYYFYNATSNGGANAVWISDYCSGKGIAGTMVVGLLSHLMGGNFARPADANNAAMIAAEKQPTSHPPSDAM